jgi:hypothetical protein
MDGAVWSVHVIVVPQTTSMFAGRYQTSVAINNLQACIHEVQAQAGRHIDAQHAQDMLMHALSVIQVLGGSATEVASATRVVEP